MAGITHIVLFKYHPSITWTDLAAHFDVFLKLREQCVKPDSRKPYMKSMKTGVNIGWENLGKGMTHGFVLEFESQEDLDYYLTEDPVHLEFSRNAAPLVIDSVVVDIKDGNLFGPAAKRPATARKYNGKCHCGQMEWTAELQSPEHILCHCDTCKKLGGGPCSLNQIIDKKDLKINKGTPALYTYTGASGKSVQCFFCPTCTSHIYHHQAIMGDKIIVRTILLDGGNQMKATAEIFGEGRLPWVGDLVDTLPSP
ncbi:hypothetical protein MMC12_008273 [Toensbergia leucococca]|nr:hypothetical protein [Toensbergia leucococca]